MYKRMYLTLFKAISKALELKDINEIKNILIQAQIEAEEICINGKDDIWFCDSVNLQRCFKIIIYSLLFYKLERMVPPTISPKHIFKNKYIARDMVY